MTHPDQLASIRRGETSWDDAFDERARWLSPAGMYTRTATADGTIDGIRIPSGKQLSVVVGAANRDPAQFSEPGQFNVRREKRPSLAFGSGSHFCVGFWAARAMVARHAVPAFFDAFPEVRLDPRQPRVFTGWVYRKATTLTLQWAE